MVVLELPADPSGVRYKRDRYGRWRFDDGAGWLDLTEWVAGRLLARSGS